MVRRLLSVVLVLVLVQLFPGGFAAPTLAQTRFDGATIFQGLFLGLGPVAEMFPEVWESAEMRGAFARVGDERAVKAAFAGESAKIIRALANEDPTYFDRFGQEIQSGDHVRIKTAMEDAAKRLTRYYEPSIVESLSPNGRDATITTQNQVQVMNYSHVTNVSAVTNVGAVVVVFFVMVALVLIVFLDVEENGQSSLQRDMYVDLIAHRLS